MILDLIGVLVLFGGAGGLAWVCFVLVERATTIVSRLGFCFLGGAVIIAYCLVVGRILATIFRHIVDALKQRLDS